MVDNMIKIKSKLPEVGLSIFAVMSKMSESYNAINLSQGFPDFNCSDELVELVDFYMKKGANQYAPMPGVSILREEICRKIKNLYNAEYDFENEIVITAGATQAIFTALSTIIKSGDEVIIFEPAYDAYKPDIELNGGVAVSIPLTKNVFRIDWTLVEKHITRKTKAIILNFPHNPTGSILSKADIEKLEILTKNSDIFIISDEVYEHIVFDNQKHISISQSEELYKRSFVISSFGKTFHTTGWKIGYCAAPKNLMDEFKKLHQFVVFAVNTPIQYAYADFLSNRKNYLEVNSLYENKRNLLLESLKNSNFKFKATTGTYFQLLDYSKISDMTDMNFAEYLTKEIGVAVIPLSPFYTENNKGRLVRVCFAKNDDVLIKAAKKLSSI